MDNNDGFVPIIAVFYAVFHPTEGTKIVHQVPEGSIASYSDSKLDKSEILFNFDTIKNYIIPKPQLCNKLVSFKANGYRVLGYPINIEGSNYCRNSFNFNFGFVFPYNSDTTPYESAIRRMGKMFRALEEQSYLLSKMDRDHVFLNHTADRLGVNVSNYTPGHQKIQKFTLLSIESLIHQIFQDLNNYLECCIPIDSANSVDIKLFPILPPPLNLKAYQVPLSTVKLTLLIDVNWDPTMMKIIPFINGLNSVKRISELADADYMLTKNCIQHLMHYQCISMVDIFQFNNIYAPTSDIGDFLKSAGMAEECQAYIISANNDEPARLSTPITPATPDADTMSNLPAADQDPRNFGPRSINSQGTSQSTSPLAAAISGRIAKSSTSGQKNEIRVPSKATLFYLYRLLNQGQTIKEWFIQYQKILRNIDVRRFITFGIVRGIIYRVNLYPVLHSMTKSLESNDQKVDSLKILIESYRPVSVEKKHRTLSSTSDRRNSGLLKDSVNEANLLTGKKARTVSFNYNVDQQVFSSDDDGEGDDYFRGLEMSSSDSEIANKSANRRFLNIPDLAILDDSDVEEERARQVDLLRLVKLIRGTQHMDSICTELRMSRNEVEKMISKLGAHSIINS